ncbi:MAG: GNAT family N-acetyltransferase [Bacteroidia bacterium]|nr:GNAT family N-acetyltransferase [Bacteroidia bacterium]
MEAVYLIPLDRYNWELCLSLQLKPGQEAFIPPILYSLAQARFENLTPMGILCDDQMAGFVMYGEFGGICWITRIMVDAAWQEMGVGSEACRQLIRLLKMKVACREIRTSYSVENIAAGQFFRSLGFVPIGEPSGGEVVAALA